MGWRSCRRAPRRRSSSCTPSTTCRSSPSRSGARGRRATPCVRSRPSSPQELSEIAETSKACSSSAAQPRAVRVEPDPDRMAAAGVSWTQLTAALGRGVPRQDAGTAVRANREIRVVAGPLFRDARRRCARGGGASATAGPSTWRRGPRRGRPRRATGRVFYSPGPARAGAAHPAGREYPAVTIALAKRPGANATALAAARAARRWRQLRQHLLPADVRRGGDPQLRPDRRARSRTSSSSTCCSPPSRWWP